MLIAWKNAAVGCARPTAVPSRTWAAVSILAALAITLTGCSGSSAAGPAPTTVTSPPAGPRLPFPGFLGAELALVDFAHQKLRNRCLADAGYPQNHENMAAEPRNAYSHLDVTPANFGATSEFEARKRGFGRDSPAEPPRVISFDRRYDARFDECARQAWQRLGSDAREVFLRYYELGDKLSGPLHRTYYRKLSAELRGRLVTCLAGAGYPISAPANFLVTPLPVLLGVPTGSLAPAPGWRPDETRATVQVGPAVPARSYLPTAGESELAVAWFRCRQQVRLTELQLTRAAQTQRMLAERHRTEFATLNPRLRELATAARQT